MSVICEVTDHIAYITLNRPEAHNAVSPEMVVKLNEIWEEYRDNPDIYCAILTGAGEKSFCTGLDLSSTISLKTKAKEPRNEVEKIVAGNPVTIDYAMLRDFELYKPVIAAINGFALAGGMELVQACDIRVAAENAKFGLREVSLGLFPLGASTVRLPRQVSYCNAMEIMLTGGLFSAQRALEMGFVNHVVPQEQLMGKAEKIAKTIAANGPLSVKAIKESVIKCMGEPVNKGLSIEQEYGDKVFASDDAKEGPLAFIEKRKPQFMGQ